MPTPVVPTPGVPTPIVHPPVPAAAIAADQSTLTADEETLDAEVNTAESAFINRGHEIIKTEMARAQILGQQYPVVRFLLPIIVSTLQQLFSHLTEEKNPVPVPVPVPTVAPPVMPVSNSVA